MESKEWAARPGMMCVILALAGSSGMARISHIIPGLAAHSLLSIVQLRNAGCEVSITKIACTVRYRGRLILQGQKCSRTGLWMAHSWTFFMLISTVASSALAAYSYLLEVGYRLCC